MKVLLAVSELSPYASSGVLSDNAKNFLSCIDGSIEMECVIPFYSTIDEKKYNITPTGKGFQVPVADKFENAEIWQGVHPDTGTKMWFIASRYFERDGLYGNVTGDYPDNSERFVFFSRAVLELSTKITNPDIIHCNDWQTALIPLYIKEVYRKNGLMQDVKTILTVHDIRFQGRFWLYDLYILNLGWEVYSTDKLEYYGDINFLKGGIVYCDAVFTINSGYLAKICNKEEGCGLEGVINSNKSKTFPIFESCSNSFEECCKDPSAKQHISNLYKKVFTAVSAAK
ncbi:MAG TPA: glycogen/starch synthase [bacterium]|nr:glycogen/starch synthase [bacterium]HPS29450.1 glycogen/starch synthase [bacterium]